jgi:hypothetical protein
MFLQALRQLYLVTFALNLLDQLLYQISWLKQANQ